MEINKYVEINAVYVHYTVLPVYNTKTNYSSSRCSRPAAAAASKPLLIINCNRESYYLFIHLFERVNFA